MCELLCFCTETFRRDFFHSILIKPWKYFMHVTYRSVENINHPMSPFELNFLIESFYIAIEINSITSPKAIRNLLFCEKYFTYCNQYKLQLCIIFNLDWIFKIHTYVTFWLFKLADRMRSMRTNGASKNWDSAINGSFMSQKSQKTTCILTI